MNRRLGRAALGAVLAFGVAAGTQACSRDDAAKQPAAPKQAPPPKPSEVFPPDPNAGQPIASPFGDPWDPTKAPPAPVEAKGPGITAANIVASGPGDVEELPRPAGTAAVFYVVVADVTVAPGSTTDNLGPSSVTLTPASGAPVALFAACMPTLEDAAAVTAQAGTRTAAWTVAIGEKTWRCGGRTARMTQVVGPEGFKLTAPAEGWTGPMVLLFEGQAEPPKSVTIAGQTAPLPAKHGS